MSARWTQARYRAFCAKMAGHGKAKAKVPRVKAWSKPEIRYNLRFLGGKGEYEPEEIQITPDDAEKHVYTPDFRTLGDTVYAPVPVYHEVKGSYRLQSQDAARLRWLFASIARPFAWFVWAKERKDGAWDIEIARNGRVVFKNTKVLGYKLHEKFGGWEVLWQTR